ncbi:MAG: GNAT family N-acetyltransferase [Actinomycetaceae bacterium]|nr:GNAT family N-acetyltransferase [Actinomycetaceae bacterium]
MLDDFQHNSALNPDRVVRPAVPTDAGRIASIQAKAMLVSLSAGIDGELDPSVEESMDVAQMEKAWQEAINAPASSGQVLVALEKEDVAGFAAAIQGAPIPIVEGLQERGSEIIALEIDEGMAGLGHRSRLLSALADLAKRDGMKNLRVWIVAGDGEKIRLFQEAGFGPAGVKRKLEVGPHNIIEHLWWAKF